MLAPSAKFCGECGEPVGTKSMEPTAGRAPGIHTPKHLAEKILMSKAALEGERKQVTVLFADMRASMELISNRDPEEARELLDPVLARMMDAVHSYEGMVNQVMGDGIMALFGAPVANEDHAVRACYAALRMQETVGTYAAELLRKRGTSIQIRVGLNSGEVVVRAIRSDLHLEYTAVGETTHLAARMEQLATPGTILLAPNTLRLAEGLVDVRPLGPVPIRGLSSPVEVYELLGVSTVSPPIRGRGRELTPFVGRDSELAQVRDAVARAAAGQGGLVAIVGAPGLGKSRLCYEFARWAAAPDGLVLESGAVSYGHAIPYLPIIELLRSYFGIESRDDARRVTEKVVNRLLAAQVGLETALTPLLALIDVPVNDPEWQGLDPAQQRRRTMDAIKRLWIGAARARPLCIILENLHWIDSETQLFLDSFVDSLPSHRVLLVVTYRPEYQHQWASRSYYTQLTLNPLTLENTHHLIGSLLGEDETLGPVHRMLVDRAGGNPLFLEELIRALAETHVLVGERGAYRLEHPLPTAQVPPTVQAVLAARMDRLSPEDKGLLQSAAVIGTVVPFPLLEAVAGLAPDALRAALGRLQSAEFLYETALFPDLEYTFTHALTHDVAYASLLQERRRALHQAVVRSIEARYPDQLAEHVDALAAHSFRGELWPAAAAYLTQAGLKAFARSAHRAAAARFREAIVALDRLPDAPTVLEQRIDVRLALRNALVPIGETQEVMMRLREAASFAERIEDRTRGGWVSGYMSACDWSIGDYVTALASARHTLAVGKELGDDALCLYADVALTWTHHSLGDYVAGVRAGREAVAYLEGDRLTMRLAIPSLPAVLARTWLVSCLIELGQFGEAAGLADEALRLAEAVGEPWSLADASLGLGVFRLRRGEPEEAARVLERGIENCRRYNIDVWMPPLTSALGYARALTGRTSEALVLLRAAIAQATATGHRFYHTLAEVWIAEALSLDGHPDEAGSRASAALRLAERYGEMGNKAYALRLLGELGVYSGAAQEAETHFREAIALAGAGGMKPLEARCRLSLASVLGTCGNAVEAHALLTAALDTFRELGMVRDAARAEQTARDLLSTGRAS